MLYLSKDKTTSMSYYLVCDGHIITSPCIHDIIHHTGKTLWNKPTLAWIDDMAITFCCLLAKYSCSAVALSNTWFAVKSNGFILCGYFGVFLTWVNSLDADVTTWAHCIVDVHLTWICICWVDMWHDQGKWVTSIFLHHFLKTSKCFSLIQTPLQLDIWLPSYERFDNA